MMVNDKKSLFSSQEFKLPDFRLSNLLNFQTLKKYYFQRKLFLMELTSIQD
jgi:hypothetical protein